MDCVVCVIFAFRMKPLLTPTSRLIVALDTPSLVEAERLVEELAPHVGCFKVGLELLTAEGAPKVVRAIHDRAGHVFLDGKFSDIPNTVAGASRSAANLGVQFFDVHACCGPKGIRAACENKGNSLCLVVTVLTSFDDEGARQVFGQGALEKVKQFVAMAIENGADGVVCSPRELAAVRSIPGAERLFKVTPGVRPAWAAVDDQQRVLTPGEAIREGATHLVIGRPILRPPKEVGSPVEAAKRITAEIAEALR